MFETFHPYLGKMNPFWLICLDGLVQPPTSKSFEAEWVCICLGIWVHFVSWDDWMIVLILREKPLETTKESNQITASPTLLVLIRMTWGILSWNNQRIFWADGLEARKTIPSKGYHRYLKSSFGWVMKVVRCQRFRTPCWNSQWRMSYVLSILVNGLFTHFWMRVVIYIYIHIYTWNPKQPALNGCLAKQQFVKSRFRIISSRFKKSLFGVEIITQYTAYHIYNPTKWAPTSYNWSHGG